MMLRNAVIRNGRWSEYAGPYFSSVSTNAVHCSNWEAESPIFLGLSGFMAKLILADRVTPVTAEYHL